MSTAPLPVGYADVRRCPLCDDSSRSDVARLVDTLGPEINRYLPADVSPLPEIVNTLVQCARCDLMYLAPRLDDASLERLYALWYRFAYGRVFDDSAHIAVRRGEFLQQHVPALVRSKPRPGRLLDIGCGSGLFLQLAREHGWDGVGIEFDAYAAEQATQMYGVNVRVGRLGDALEADELFDAITMFDYLEHTPAPGADIAMAVGRLAPDGVLLIRVPNRDGWQARWMGWRWLAVISNHLSYFSADVLRHCLESHGLRIVVATARNSQSEIDIVSQRVRWLFGRLHALCVSEIPPGAHSGAVNLTRNNGTFGAILRLFDSVLIEQIDHVGGWFGRGNNLFVVARR